MILFCLHAINTADGEHGEAGGEAQERRAAAPTAHTPDLRFSHKLFPTVKTNCEFPGPSKVSGGYVSSVRASGQVLRKNLVLLLICNHESVENLTSNLIFTAYLLPHRDIKLWSDVFFIVIPVLRLINLV